MRNPDLTCAKAVAIMLLVLVGSFYNIVILLVFTATGYATPSVSDCISELVLVCHLTPDSFMGCYLVFFFFIPFLNILIRNMSQQH